MAQSATKTSAQLLSGAENADDLFALKTPVEIETGVNTAATALSNAATADGKAVTAQAGVALNKITSVLNLINANGSQSNSIDADDDPSLATMTTIDTKANVLIAHPTLTNDLEWRFNTEKFTPSEAIAVLDNGTGARLHTTTVQTGGNISGTISQVTPSWSFYTDAEKICLRTLRSIRYTIEINDTFLSKTESTTEPVGDGIVTNIVLVFPSKTVRKITINFQTSGTSFHGVLMSPSDTVWPTENELSMAFFGDSFGTGTDGNPSGYSYCVAMSKALSISGYQMTCIGGTSFTASAGAVGFTYAGRYISDITHKSDWDIISASSSTNDATATESEINSGVDAWYDLAKANHPSAILLIVGSPRSVTPRPTGESGDFVLAEQRILARFESKNDPFVITIPTLTNINPPVFGTGRISAPNGTGNADIYVGDGLHYDDAGHLYHGRWLARQVKAALKAKIKILSA